MRFDRRHIWTVDPDNDWGHEPEEDDYDHGPECPCESCQEINEKESADAKGTTTTDGHDERGAA